MRCRLPLTLTALWCTTTAITCSEGPVYPGVTSTGKLSERHAEPNSPGYESQWCDDSQAITMAGSGIPGHCHTQGLGFSGDTVVVACEKTNNGAIQAFHVTPAANGDVKLTPGAVRRTREFFDKRHDHPNVGNGTRVTAFEGQDPKWTKNVIPAVIATGEQIRDNFTPVVVMEAETLDTVCEFNHWNKDHAGTADLGAVAMFAHDNRTFLAACGYSCDEFYIYELEDLEQPQCGAKLLLEHDSRKWRSYQGIAIMPTEGGELLMLGTAQTRLQVRQLKNFDPDDLSKLEFPGVGSYQETGNFRRDEGWRWAEQSKPHFHQGLATRPMGNGEIEIWTAPLNAESTGKMHMVRCRKDVN